MIIISDDKNMNIYLKLALVSFIFFIFSTISYIIFLPFSAESLNPMLKSFSNVPLSHLLAIKFVELVLYFMINYIYGKYFLIFYIQVLIYIRYFFTSLYIKSSMAIYLISGTSFSPMDNSISSSF